MARTLLLRGMLAGFIAGLIVFGFASFFGEPYVERAIAVEAHMELQKGEPPEEEMVSRHVQRGIGLLTGVVAYGVALGGVFGLTFGYVRGRLSALPPRPLSLSLATIGFVAIVLAPSLKYPANPPSIGTPETIGIRTAAYFLFIATSLIAVAVSTKVWHWCRHSMGHWNAALLAVLLYAGLLTLCGHFLPGIDEVPSEFPASLLWSFRVASFEIQLILWVSIGLVFGWLTERAEGVPGKHRTVEVAS